MTGLAARLARTALRAPVASVALARTDKVHCKRCPRDASAITHLAPAQAAAVALAAGSSPAHGPPADQVMRRLMVSVGALHLRARLATVADLVADGATPRAAAGLLGNGSPGHELVPAALLAWLARPRRPVATLLYATALGGESPVIASMAGALAGAQLGRTAWPRQLLGRLEGQDEVGDSAELLSSAIAMGPTAEVCPQIP